MKTKLKHISLKTVVDRIKELEIESYKLEERFQERVRISMKRKTINTQKEQFLAKYLGRRISDNRKRINELEMLLK